MTKSNHTQLTQKHLKEALHYNPDTGVFTWLISTSDRIKPGYIAGCVATNKVNKKQYLVIGLYGGQYLAHRLAFLFMTGSFPVDGVDHIDGQGLNNQWDNLRPANNVENSRNTRLPANNTSGHIGICWDKSRNKWLSRIKVNQVTINLGRFTDYFEAVCARKSAENKYCFHLNHGAVRPL